MPFSPSKTGIAAEPAEFLALEEASVRRGRMVVLPRMSWTWRQGEQWAILGPDGAGKSLLIEVLLGELPLSSGEFRMSQTASDPGQIQIAHVSPLTQRQVAVQESSFYQSRWHSDLEEGQRTVEQFLSQAAVEERNPFEVGAQQRDSKGFVQRRARFMRWLGITRLYDRKLAFLSNGEMRRTLLVHALLKAPRLLILQDPFAGLDAATRLVLHRVIARLIRSGNPVLVATNRPEEIPNETTHLLLLHRHRVFAQGAKDDILRAWQKQFGAAREGNASVASRLPAKHEARCPNARTRPLIELRAVTIPGAPEPILSRINWTLREGERWALSGPNGAGKTTLLNLIQGDHPQAYAQDIRLFGRRTDSTQTIWQMRQRLGWMSPELHQHYPGEWRALDVVCSGYTNTPGLYEPVSRAQRAAARRWLADIGLLRHAEQCFHHLTFGEQRLVLLARAAVKRPRLLILDEACQGLDATQRSTLLAAVDRVVAQTGASLIFVTHHAKELPHCITHEVRLIKGRIHYAGIVQQKR